MATVQTGIATDLITFSRTSNATVTDSDGKIKWAPHNLLLASEQFDAASWTKTSITPTANAVAAPNGTTTADTLTASGANGTTLQSYTSLGVSYTFGIWLKRKTGTGNIQIAADSGTYTTVTITSDWALYTVTQTPAAGSISAGIRIVTSADAVEAWGAHLYRSDLGGMKANTSAYPMYNPTTPKNLLGFTQSFDNAYWLKFAVAVPATKYADPYGGTTANLLYPTAATTDAALYKGGFPSVSKTHSYFVKAAGKSWFCILKEGTSGGAAWFNLSTGLVGTVAAGYTAPNPVSLGNGWYRCSVTSTSGFSQYTAVSAVDADNSTTPTPNGTDGIYIWGAQLSDSASIDPYSPVYGAAPTAAAYYGPRLDFDPVTLAAKGLLVEEQRTNSLLHTTAFDNAAWTPFSLNTTGTPQWVNAATAPDGTMTADKIIPSTSSTDVHAIASTATIAVDNTTAYTWSVYAKADGYDWISVVAYTNSVSYFTWFNVATGAVGTNTAGNTAHPPVAVGNGWYRLSVTRTTASIVAQFILYAANADNKPTFAGDGTKGVLVWGAQLEKGSFPTSYIPNGDAIAGATRNPDVASVSTQAFPYNQAEGSVVVNATLGNTSTNGPVALTINDGTGNNEIYILQTVGTGTRRSVLIYAGGAPQATLAESLTNTVGLTTKVAGAFKLNDVAGSIDGGTVVTDTPPATIPTVNTMRIGNVASGTQAFNGHIRQITYLPRRISNAELITRTS